MRLVEPLVVVMGSVSWKKDVSIVLKTAVPVKGHVAWITGRPVVRTLRLWSVCVLRIRDVAIRRGTLSALLLLTFVEAVMGLVAMLMRRPGARSRKRKYVFVSKIRNVARWPGTRVAQPSHRKFVWVAAAMVCVVMEKIVETAGPIVRVKAISSARTASVRLTAEMTSVKDFPERIA